MQRVVSHKLLESRVTRYAHSLSVLIFESMSYEWVVLDSLDSSSICILTLGMHALRLKLILQGKVLP